MTDLPPWPAQAPADPPQAWPAELTHRHVLETEDDGERMDEWLARQENDRRRNAP